MPANDVSIRIGGEAGQGVESSGTGFAEALTRGGVHVFAEANYRSRIRGGHNFFTVRAGSEPVYAVRDKIQVLIALTAETVELHINALEPGGAVIVDPEIAFDESILQGKDVRLLRPPLLEIAGQEGNRIMSNTGALAYGGAHWAAAGTHRARHRKELYQKEHAGRRAERPRGPALL